MSTKLDEDLVRRAAKALFDYENKKGQEKNSNKKLALLEAHAKPVISQVKETIIAVFLLHCNRLSRFIDITLTSFMVELNANIIMSL